MVIARGARIWDLPPAIDPTVGVGVLEKGLTEPMGVEAEINAMLTAETRELSLLTEIKNTFNKIEPNLKKIKTEGVQEAFFKIGDIKSGFGWKTFT